MSPIGSVDAMLTRPSNGYQYAIVGFFIVLLSVVVVVGATVLHEAAHSLVVGLAQNVSTRQSDYLGAIIEADGAGGGDSEYFANVEVATSSFSVAEDIGLGVVDAAAGRAFQGVRRRRMVCSHSRSGSLEAGGRRRGSTGWTRGQRG